MRRLTSLTLAVVMFSAGLVLTTTAHAQAPKIKGVETKSGVEVATRVEGLRRDSLNVRSALHMFERSGHRPKIEDANSVSGELEQPSKVARNERGFAIRKANFVQTIRDGSIELIFVPVLDLPAEWQGTMIARLYNQHNQVVSEEVFNLVMVREGSGRWLPVYELSFSDGYPYVHHEPGMFASFALGVTIADHPTVSGSAPDTNFQPWQIGDEPGPDPCHLRPGLDCLAPTRGAFRRVSYRDMASNTPLVQRVCPGPPQECFPGRCLSPGSHCNNAMGRINNTLGLPGLMVPRVRQTAHDAFPRCAAAGVVFGGNLVYFARGCGGELIYQAGRHIFRIW